MTLVHTFAGIAWDPEIRGILTVVVGVVVLMGSVYLLLSTNVAGRLGFLLSLAAVFGWLAMLGLTWWLYPPGNGPIGRVPSWHIEEINHGDLGQAQLSEANNLDTSGLPSPEELRDHTSAEVVANVLPAFFSPDWSSVVTEAEGEIRIVDIQGRRSHAVIAQGLQLLINLLHRGACGCEVFGRIAPLVQTLEEPGEGGMEPVFPSAEAGQPRASRLTSAVIADAVAKAKAEVQQQVAVLAQLLTGTCSPARPRNSSARSMRHRAHSRCSYCRPPAVCGSAAKTSRAM